MMMMMMTRRGGGGGGGWCMKDKKLLGLHVMRMNTKYRESELIKTEQKASERHLLFDPLTTINHRLPSYATTIAAAAATIKQHQQYSNSNGDRHQPTWITAAVA